MGKLQESIIYVVANRRDLLNIPSSYTLWYNQPMVKVLLKEYLSTGKSIGIDKLTSELEQIIRYNNGYLEHKYKIRYL